MERLLQGTAGTLSATFYIGDTPTDPSPDTAVVTITRADGTALVSGAATTPVGTGGFTYTLTPSQTALLDRLTATWTATLSGQVQSITTRVEVVGGFLVSSAELRADSTLSDQTAYPDARLTTLRTVAERALEDACRVAFVPRYEHETVYGSDSDWLPVRWRRVRSVRTLDGVAASSVQVVGGAIRAGGFYGGSDVTVGYEHGHDFPPPETSRIVSRLIRHYAIDSPLDDRAMRLDAENGSWVMSTPGMKGQHFGIPEVDAFVEAHGYKKPGMAAVPIVS